MPDVFGSLTLPATAPAAGTTPGDPALGVLASFLAAALNAQCGALWTASGVCPGRLVVTRYYTHDPRELFDDSKLPALYLWCSKGKTDLLASDLLEDLRIVNVLWVLEGGQQEHQISRVTVFNAVAKAAQKAIRAGRDPSWVVTGDTDPYAATEGSLYMQHAGFSKVVSGPYQPQNTEIYITDGEGKPMAFPALAMSFEVTELCVDDTDLNTYPAAIDVDVDNMFDEEMGTVEDLPV